MVTYRLHGAFMNPRTLSLHSRETWSRCREPAMMFARAITMLGLMEPRKSKRTSCRGGVFCHPVTLRRGRSWQAVVHDLSLGGIGLVSAEPLEPGKVLAVCFPRALDDVPQPLLMTVVHLGFA